MTDAARIGLIWAQADDRVIGREGGMPWHVPEDLAHFKAITLGAPVVMGRGTWESLDPRYRPLPGRRNIVITRRSDWTDDGAEWAGSVSTALAHAAADGPAWIWVIGGGEVFAETVGLADRLEVTQLSDVEGFEPEPDDVRAPAIDPAVFRATAADPAVGEHASRSGIRYRFLRYDRERRA